MSIEEEREMYETVNNYDGESQDFVVTDYKTSSQHFFDCFIITQKSI